MKAVVVVLGTLPVALGALGFATPQGFGLFVIYAARPRHGAG